MSIDLRIPVTPEQKKRIMNAIADEPTGFAAWARTVLLKEAEKRIAKTVETTDRSKTAQN